MAERMREVNKPASGVDPSCGPTETVDEIDLPALRARYARERDRRLRDGQAQYIVTEGDWAAFYEADPHMPVVPRAPLSAEADVVVLGGGFAGLIAGARLKQAGVEDVRIIELGRCVVVDFGAHHDETVLGHKTLTVDRHANVAEVLDPRSFEPVQIHGVVDDALTINVVGPHTAMKPVMKLTIPLNMRGLMVDRCFVLVSCCHGAKIGCGVLPQLPLWCDDR
jgi:hypothetical protein